MSDDMPSIISHVSIGTNQFEQAVSFYDRVLEPLGCRRVMEHPGAVAYGRQFPEFWVQAPIDGKAATIGNGTHIGFLAPSKQVVDAFYQAAVAAGAKEEGAPGPRQEYGEPYYGCFVRDLDGHKIEAHFWDMSLMPAK
ncbi:VOC family protein [Spartinivicinus poritis]|uniref:VOC family protein n=1 Tax=Spartinivicinus poritis TaxID=2994640 RepID=A0ABT5UAQ8_9GAMM|nr:VOC family protein [Spartinivicinus sp. A2-2]MDE1463463.1 VOC family protein [Spartinivicinus sp. A2-2]